jgi:hypothetical protein
MNWTPLDPDKAEAFLDAVRNKTENALFLPALCTVHTRPLPFYDGYSLYRIVNRHMLPLLVLDYFSNGENHYYMDGSESAFENLNSRDAISLGEDNVLGYLDLYISYVYERGNSLGFIRDPRHTVKKGAAAMESHFSAITLHSKSAVSFDSANGRYTVKTPLIYQDKTVDSLIEIEKNGAIHILEPLQVSFLQAPRPETAIPYRHPFEGQIIEQSKALLAETAHGRTLLAITDETDVDIRVLGSPNYQGFITNDGIIYLTMPAAEQSGKILQALILAACLRDVEQIRGGYPHPNPTGDETVFALANYGKNLDMIVEMCKIVEELEKQGRPEALGALRDLGHESVYGGYKNRLEDNALMEVYLSALERHGIIKR